MNENEFLSSIKKSFEIGFDTGIISLALKVNFPEINYIFGIDTNKQNQREISRFKHKMGFTNFSLQHKELNQELVDMPND